MLYLCKKYYYIDAKNVAEAAALAQLNGSANYAVSFTGPDGREHFLVADGAVENEDRYRVFSVGHFDERGRFVETGSLKFTYGRDDTRQIRDRLEGSSVYNACNNRLDAITREMMKPFDETSSRIYFSEIEEKHL